MKIYIFISLLFITFNFSFAGKVKDDLLNDEISYKAGMDKAILDLASVISPADALPWGRQTYGVMTGDRWKVTNAIYSVFNMQENRGTGVNETYGDGHDGLSTFDRLVQYLVTGKNNAFGGACDIAELTFGGDWLQLSPTQGRYLVENFYANGCKGVSELTSPRYNFGSPRYGYLFQFCSQIFYGGFDANGDELSRMGDVVEALKDKFQEKLLVKLEEDEDAAYNSWTSAHTEVLYKHFYPSYNIKNDELELLHQSVCESGICDYSDSFELLSYSLCTDVAWIDN